VIAVPPIGVGPAYHLPADPPAVHAGRPVAGMPCTLARQRPVTAHVELFANGRALLLPPGIGVSRPQIRHVVVVGGACAYPVRTLDPTGVVFADRPGLRLGQLFALWGQPLGPGRLAGFRGPVRVFVGGRRNAVDPRRVVLNEHAEIVVEVGRFVPPHVRYRFPKGLARCARWC
jgi:hypothetical protein